MDITEIKRQKVATIVKWGLGLVGVAVIAPVVFLVVKGIIGLIIAALLGFSFITFAPVVAMKFANWKVKAIVHEAQTNPIETLINLATEKRDALGNFKQSITNFRTQVSNFEQKVETFKAQYPEEASKFEGQLQGMKRLLSFREGRYKNAKGEVEAFERTIERARALWEMSQEAQRMNKYAGMQTGDPFEQIKTDVSLDSVMSSVNKAFSELETALLDESTTEPQPAQLTHQQPAVLPSSIVDAELVPVPVKRRTA